MLQIYFTTAKKARPDHQEHEYQCTNISQHRMRRGELWFQILQCGSIIMFPYRRSRSQSAHIAGGINIKSDERQSKGRKKELFPADKK
ncbi:unnamed protein product [Arabidopsis lyrata]|nr:unnamed protein product [Arabidopsis lyrata]